MFPSHDHAGDTAYAILKEHGEKCDTMATASQFLKRVDNIEAKYSEIVNYGENEAYEREEEINDENEHFLHNILQNYLLILKKEFEYLTSEEAIIETIESNEYTFTEDGELKNA